MCVNYRPANRGELENWFGVAIPPDLEWPAETWQDYSAPFITRSADGGRQVLVGSYGMVPKRHIPPHVKRFTTMNARSETVGKLRSYSRAWKSGQLCLVPMVAFYEPNWESGKHVRFRIERPDGKPFAAAGLWRAWEEEDGSTAHSFTQLTVNADEHDVLRRFHRAGDEKRSLAIVPPEEYDSWLACSDPELARSFMRLMPSNEYACMPAPKGATDSAQLTL